MGSIADEYASGLEALVGDDFQAEVCARLQGAILGFQSVPARPSGDGGLDGFAEGGKRGFCCYGPEPNAFKTVRGRASDVVEKFSGDLRRLFELETKGKGLVHRDNPELATILPPGIKIVHIELIVNRFDDHRVLGRLGAVFEACKGSSLCRYVERTATMTVSGPTQLANMYSVDEFAVYRVRQRGLVARVREAATEEVIPDPGSFDIKMDRLRELQSTQIAAIDEIAKNFREDWRTALAFERMLTESLPDLHRALEEDRRSLVTQVSMLMVGADQPWKELGQAHNLAVAALRVNFEKLFGSIVADIASGEIARLIGECPIGWQKPA